MTDLETLSPRYLEAGETKHKKICRYTLEYEETKYWSLNFQNQVHYSQQPNREVER